MFLYLFDYEVMKQFLMSGTVESWRSDFVAFFAEWAMLPLMLKKKIIVDQCDSKQLKFFLF